MNIKYTNYVASDYKFSKTNKDDIIFFCSTDKFSPTWETTIILSEDYETFLDEESIDFVSNVTEELLNAKKIKDALAFTKNYGALINTKLFAPNHTEFRNGLSSRIHYVIYGCDIDLGYDLILYEHFLFYQYELYHLQKLHSNLTSLSQNENSPLFFYNLLVHTLNLLANPYLDCCINIEYELPYINEIVTDSFPFFKLRLKVNNYLQTNLTNIAKYSCASYPFITENDYDKSYEFYAYNRQAILDLFRSNSNVFPKIFPSSIFKSFMMGKDENDNYWLRSKNSIIQFAESVFNDILSFHLKEIYPLSGFSADSTEFCWHFPSLIHAIFFDFYVKINEKSAYKICANERCNKLFLYTAKNSPNKKFCSQRCAHNTTNRKSIRKKREQSKSITNN